MHTQPAIASRQRRVLRWLRREALPLLVLILLLTAARSSLANHYHVPSGSMQPALQPGDRVVVDMRAYGWRLPFTTRDLVTVADPAPGEVVVFDSPVDGTRLIKRVAAVGGQRVEVRGGRLLVDGQRPPMHGRPAEEQLGSRRITLDLAQGGGADFGPLRVPHGEVLVLGDHRGASFDGRYFGLVPVDAFYGRAVAVYHRRGDGFGWRRL
ncbi:signal peptidase I [Luteimonas yindakuii]|uniref:signal peptidase I n=1 Tax=Luteimonas yindakuii TaxID=2565782 RepID=UPI0010A44892|nr:signal peptidase I [Luteimonas yindakuii]QCO68307.1 signal peptidase I [Luteimonas yindakuii]